MGFMKRAWRGEERLWRVFWLGAALFNLCWAILTLLLCTALFFGFKKALGLPVAINAAGIVYLLMTLSFQIWSWVAQWRCAWNVDWRAWGVIVRILVVLGVISFVWQAYSLLQSGPTILAGITNEAVIPVDSSAPAGAQTPALPGALPQKQNDLAGSMLCISQYQPAAKEANATRESKVALCDCIVNKVGHVESTAANYEAEMTRCFAKLIGEPYVQVSPSGQAATTAADNAVINAPLVPLESAGAPTISLPGSEDSAMPSAPVTGTAPAPTPPPAPPGTPPETQYTAQIASIPKDQLPALESHCLMEAKEKAKEKGADESLFLSLNQGYIDFCILSRARNSGVLPPEAPPAKEGK